MVSTTKRAWKVARMPSTSFFSISPKTAVGRGHHKRRPSSDEDDEDEEDGKWCPSPKSPAGRNEGRRDGGAGGGQGDLTVAPP